MVCAVTKAKVITLSNIRFIVTADNLWLVREDIMGLFGYGSGDYYVSPDYKFVLNKDGKVISPVIGTVDHIELTEDIHGDALQIHLINEAGIMQLEPSSWDCNGRSMDSFLKEKAIPRLHECQKDFVEDKKMANELTVFENAEFGKVRTIVIDGEPWLVGKDVAEILGYSNTRKAIADHVDGEDKQDGVTIRDSIGRYQNPIVINESGFYSLVIGSKLPAAKRFKRWVTSEVLPSIRKTGQYVAKPMDSYMIADPIERAKAWIKEEERRIALTAEVKELTPLAEQTEKYIEHGHLMKFRELSKELKIHEPTLRMIVVDILHWMYKSGKKYVPYKSTVLSGFMAAHDAMNKETGWTGVGYGFTIAGRMEIEKVYADLQKKITA